MPPAKIKTIDEVLEGIGELRLFPPAAQKVLRLANNPAANLRSIEQAVKLDPVLTARVLKIANSAYYGAPQRIATLGQALGVMGFEPARELSVALALGSLQAGDTLKDRNLWEHSLQTATTSRLLGRYVRGVDNNALFIAGLLHDIGQSLMASIARETYLPLSLKFGFDYSNLIKAELFAFKFDHAELGARCLEHWGLPLDTVNMVRYHHHEPTDLDIEEPDQRAALVLTIAEQLVLGYEKELRGLELIKASTAELNIESLGIDQATLMSVVELMTEEFMALSAFQ